MHLFTSIAELLLGAGAETQSRQTAAQSRGALDERAGGRLEPLEEETPGML